MNFLCLITNWHNITNEGKTQVLWREEKKLFKFHELQESCFRANSDEKLFFDSKSSSLILLPNYDLV